MVRALASLVLIAACGSHTTGSDAQGTTIMCEAKFDQAVNRTCATAGDCVLLMHPDCCGPVMIGVNATAQTQPAETQYETCMNSVCGARGCQHALMAEDGRVPSAGQSIVATCIGMVCSSTVQ